MFLPFQSLNVFTLMNLCEINALAVSDYDIQMFLCALAVSLCKMNQTHPVMSSSSSVVAALFQSLLAGCTPRAGRSELRR